jgi:hypothetical protein
VWASTPECLSRGNSEPRPPTAYSRGASLMPATGASDAPERAPLQASSTCQSAEGRRVFSDMSALKEDIYTSVFPPPTTIALGGDASTKPFSFSNAWRAV